MLDYAIVGGGIGGVLSATLLWKQKKNILLFEKSDSLGGCAGTFERKGVKYNIGATTFCGYEDNQSVKKIFNLIDFAPNIKIIDPAIVVIQNGKKIERFYEKDKFIDKIQDVHFHKKNREFWNLVYEINYEFYNFSGYYYDKKNLYNLFLSTLSFMPIVKRYKKYLFYNAKKFIIDFFGDISGDYLDFLDAQIMIVAQTRSDNINFLVASLALGYTFNKNYYAIGGMGQIFNDIIANNKEKYYLNSEITKIYKKDKYYLLETKTNQFISKNIILNSSLYDSYKIFIDDTIKNYLFNFRKLNNYQSAFIVYANIQTNILHYHHYQIILNKNIINTISNAIFVSFSDKDDLESAKNGQYSMTASIHVDLREFDKGIMTKEEYKRKKLFLQNEIMEIIINNLELNSSNCKILDIFSATPSTFIDYLGRGQLGGNAMTFFNSPPLSPANNSPIEGLYFVGDTSYAAQGWPGVANGVLNLNRILNGRD